MATHSRRQTLTQARLLFNQQGAVPGGMVAEPILRSWRRCADLGFDMRGVRRAELMTQGELREAQQRNEALRRMYEPAIAYLRHQAGGRDRRPKTTGCNLHDDRQLPDALNACEPR